MLQCTFGWRENVQQQQPHCRRWWWWTMVPGTCRVPQKLNQVNHTHTHTHKSSNLMHSNAINFRFILMACNLVDVLHYYDFAGRAMCLCHRIHPSISHAEFILCTQPASPARAQANESVLCQCAWNIMRCNAGYMQFASKALRGKYIFWSERKILFVFALHSCKYDCHRQANLFDSFRFFALNAIIPCKCVWLHFQNKTKSTTTATYTNRLQERKKKLK